MIFKRDLINTDKKVLHKVRKHWVVVSVALLSMLGTGWASSQSLAAHADAGQQNQDASGNVQNSNIKTNTGSTGSTATKPAQPASAGSLAASGSSSTAVGQPVSPASVVGQLQASSSSASASSYNVTVDYVNQRGDNVSWQTSQTASDVTKNPSAFAPVPDGYTLNSGQSPALTQKGSNKTYQYNVTGNEIKNAVSVNLVKEHYEGDKYYDPTWQKVDYQGPVAQDPTLTISEPVSGRVGDFYVIDRIPTNDIPQGYTVDSRNNPIIGQFTPNGISNEVGTFDYVPDTAQILFNMVNSQNYAVRPSFKLTGHVDDAGLISDFIQLPSGYHFDAGDAQTFRMQAANPNEVMDLRVNGDQFDPATKSNYVHQLNAQLVDQNGNSLGTQSLSVNMPASAHYGDVAQVTINPENFNPANYAASTNSFTTVVRFDPNGIAFLDPSKNLFVDPSKVSLKFRYLRSDGAQSHNETDIPLNATTTNSSDTSNGNGASQLAEVHVNYVDQTGHVVGHAQKALAPGKYNLAQQLDIPNGYEVSSNDKQTTTVPANGGTYNVNVLGKQMSGSVSVNLVREPAANDRFAPKQASTQTISIPVSGRLGDTYAISKIPAKDLPAGYVPDRNNKIITGQITKNGLSTKTGEFKYDPQAASIKIEYIGTNGQTAFQPTIWNGHVGDSGSLKDIAGSLPDGYQYVDSNLGNFSVTPGHLTQDIKLNVEGQLIRPDANYNHTLVFGLADKTANGLRKIGTANVVVPLPAVIHAGDTKGIEVRPADLASSLYTPITANGVCQIVFEKDGIHVINPNDGQIVGPDALSLAYQPADTDDVNANNTTAVVTSDVNSFVNIMPASSESTSASSNASQASSSASAQSQSSVTPQSEDPVPASVSSSSASELSSAATPTSSSVQSVSSSAAPASSSSVQSISAQTVSSSASNSASEDAGPFASLINSDFIRQPSGSSSNDSSTVSDVDSEMGLINEINSLQTMPSVQAQSSNSQASSAGAKSSSNDFVSGELEFTAPNGQVVGNASIGGLNGSQYLLSMSDPAVSMNLPKGYKLADDVIQSQNMLLRKGRDNTFKVDIEPAQTARVHVSHRRGYPAYIRLGRRIPMYKSANLGRRDKKLLILDPNSTLKVLGIKRSRHGHIRYRVRVNGKTGFVPAGRYVTSAYYLPGDIKNGYVISTVKHLYGFARPSLRNQHITSVYWRDQVIPVKSVVRGQKGTCWLALKDGNYLLADKSVVHVFKLK